MAVIAVLALAACAIDDLLAMALKLGPGLGMLALFAFAYFV